MMHLLRNNEVLRGTLLMTAAAIAAAVIIAVRTDLKTGLFTAAACAMMIFLHLLTTWLRYRRIRSLAADIDKILHGNDAVSLDSYDEGELALLQCEICKMTVCLREQRQRLLSDKIYLADSIADISHQIRTPLTSINILVQLLSKPDITSERRSQICFELRQMLSRIDWLITSLLKISRLDAGTIAFNPETIPMEQLINKSCEPLLVAVDLRGLDLKINASGSFSGDIAWSCEAIGNVIKNCTEHTPPGGTIFIDGEENPLFSEIRISDTGSGISKEDLPHIFERFYKGSDSGSNSFGIGLNLARMIITGQNGTIKADNKPSGGAEFIIRFYKKTV